MFKPHYIFKVLLLQSHWDELLAFQVLTVPGKQDWCPCFSLGKLKVLSVCFEWVYWKDNSLHSLCSLIFFGCCIYKKCPTISHTQRYFAGLDGTLWASLFGWVIPLGYRRRGASPNKTSCSWVFPFPKKHKTSNHTNLCRKGLFLDLLVNLERISQKHFNFLSLKL